MGQVPRFKPKRLAEKLLQIREALGLSQNGMIRHLGLTGIISQNAISAFELGAREPQLPILLLYARSAGIWVDVLIDDELDLPANLPSLPKSEGVPRKQGSRKSKSNKAS
jgi:transcriptional regulator with XRE-family HTH domain